MVQNVIGSNPIITNFSYSFENFLYGIWGIRLSVRTRDFHSLKSGSILLYPTKMLLNTNLLYAAAMFVPNI